jgi:four helix bundle protein
MKISSFKELIVWQKGMDLVKTVYSITKELPKDELFVLGNQMRRSAVSIPSNIAEGFKRGSTKDYLHFLTIAFGSSAELETQLLLVKELYTDTSSENVSNALQLCEEIQKMISGITNKLK